MGKFKRSYQRGFNMVELLAVMAILGVLAAAVMPLGETLLVARKEHELRAALRVIRSALDEYKRTVGQDVSVAGSGSGYPASLQVLVMGTPDPRTQNKGQLLYFLRTVPRDPFADPKLPPEQTWQLRAYASPAERPEPGADVYDVHSTSKATALDGSLYAQW
ncbi:type II secretion system protein [Rhodoferax lacus]|uniref:type II secretion system protein n=1 Tax=Rhodoferax lacus TaxID=2184758 RepID=UPI001F32CC87|nr:type II secretion system protein [Rhodoferax lacus]